MRFKTNAILTTSVLVLTGCGHAKTSDVSRAEAPRPASSMPDTVTNAQRGDDWSSLDAFVGGYPNNNALFDDSAISDTLRTLLGDRMTTLETNMQTAGPLQREGSVYYTSGNKAHQGGTDAAYLLIDRTRQDLEVGLWTDGELSVYKTDGADIAKPEDIRVMIANSEDG
ncbi:hypothetical protein [uncultured Algimonas sp.]|uniref:hypothetical protein n=1 Tax=uncultured Algimonas sp. TaxID=1547920 RepID=UPI002608CF02|nr:hypothetical protein [uncultured Algimonas sp.]